MGIVARNDSGFVVTEKKKKIIRAPRAPTILPRVAKRWALLFLFRRKSNGEMCKCIRHEV